MNIYATIILIALLGEYVLGLTAKLLNVNNLHPQPPAEFTGFYEGDAYSRSQEYTRVRTRFGIITDTFDLFLVLAFWFSGGFNWLDQIVMGWELGPIWTGVAYILILIAARGILSLPFSIYSTFVIEERFGFNKTTAATFIADLLKGIALGLFLGVPILAGVLWFFNNAGAYAWLYCWAAVTFVMLFLQFIAPTWIMPLFNKFKPLEDDELKQSILSYARSVNFAVQNIFVMDGSKRSSRSNAFFAGFGKFKRIALFDTLIAQHTTPELVAVVAHEIGHYKKKHIIQSMAIGILHTGVLFYLLSIFLSQPGLFEAFYMEHISVYAGLIFFGMLLSPVELILSILMHLFSRKNEFEADHYAVSTTHTPDAMIEALKKLSANNLTNLTPHPFYVFLYYSHPPLAERIRAIRGAI